MYPEIGAKMGPKKPFTKKLMDTRPKTLAIATVQRGVS